MSLLARYALCLFWLGRYVERAENLARLLDVNEVAARGSAAPEHWQTILKINGDEPRFFKSYATADADSVVRFYVLDEANSTSIRSAVRLARENARTLRAIISTEMWSQLNVFHNAMQVLSPTDIALPKLNRLCAQIKEACQAHTGIADGTFYRDQGWYFYQLGRTIERSDQITRLVDTKYQELRPDEQAAASAHVDALQWGALLRSAGAYQAFRRVSTRSPSPQGVVSFLLHDPAFPRSLMFGVRAAERLLADLRTRYRLRGGVGALERLDELRVALEGHAIEWIVAHGLHDYLDRVQRQLIAVSNEIAYDFFGIVRPESEGDESAKLTIAALQASSASQTQTQTTSA